LSIFLIFFGVHFCSLRASRRPKEAILYSRLRKEIPVALYFRFAVVKDQQKLLCVKLGVLKFLLFDLINQIKL